MTGVAPDQGPTSGNTTVTITGTDFTGASGVSFGGTPATSFSVVSPTEITAVSPAGAGTVDVTVTTPGGSSATSSADQFTYLPVPGVGGLAPSEGPVSGGTRVTITGTGFTGVSGVSFGGTPVTSYSVVSATEVIAVSPAGTGTVDVTVTTPGGTTPTGPADQFTYVPMPGVGGVAPGQGPAAGGTQVTITGTDFTGATGVDFGGHPATSFTIVSPTEIIAVSPAGAGTVDVTVTTPGGTSPTTGSDQFIYVPAPTVTSVDPGQGRLVGGNTVVITGTGFNGVSGVQFGTNPATAYTVDSATEITATVPPGSGYDVVDVVVTADGGSSVTGSGDHYAYDAVPSAPGDPNLLSDHTTLTFTFVVPADNGSPITSFIYTLSVNGVAQAPVTVGAGGAGSPLDPTPGATDTVSVPGATVGSSYTVTVAATNGVGTGPASAASDSVIPTNPPVPPTPNPAPKQVVGYWTVATDGGVFAFGQAQFFGSMGGRPLNKPIVGLAPTGDGQGYWMDASDGGIFAFGDAKFYGSMGSAHLNAPAVSMAPTPDGGGYWLVASDGGIFSFGDAKFYGSTGSLHLNSPIVAMAATPDGGGYWLVASDGGIFAFGDAEFYGSMGGQHLNKPIVGIATTGDGQGYWLDATDGGIFAFGDAKFYGSEGGKPLNEPMVGMSSTPDGGGYWTVASDGGMFTFGDATFYGSMGGKPLNEPMVGMATYTP